MNTKRNATSHAAERDQIEVSCSAAIEWRGRNPACCSGASQGINAALSSQVCNGNLLRPEKDITMSTKISMALAALIIACASPALAGGDGNRDNWYASSSAQYCLPQFDDDPDPLRVYC